MEVNSSSVNKNGFGLGGDAIAGISIGSVLAAFVGAILVFYVHRRRNKSGIDTKTNIYNFPCQILHIAALLFWCEVYNPLVK